MVDEMDDTPEDRHVVKMSIADLQSARLDSGQVDLETPDVFLRTVLTDQPELMAAALSQLAAHRHGVDTIDHALAQLHRPPSPPPVR